jgi:hypothetical protein
MLMVLSLGGFVGRGKGGDAQGGGSAAQLVEQRAMQGLESSALGRSQILGQMEAGDVRQGLAESVQGALERSGLRRGGGALVLLGRQLPERIGEQPSPVGLVGDTE